MFGKPKSSGIPEARTTGVTVKMGNNLSQNITHSGNTRMGNKKYNRKMGSFPDGNLPFYLPNPPMLKHSTTVSRSICHPSPVVRGGGFAGRAGWFRSWAAVLLVSF
jgi:hypothetical protein